MSGSTPILGLRYPTIGDTIDAASFANLAADIDAQMSVIDGLRLLNTQRARVYSQCFNQAVVFNTSTNLLYTQNNWVLPASFHNTSVNPDQFVAPVNGLYLAMCFVSGAGLPTTATQSFAGITVNAAQVQSVSRDKQGGITWFRDMEPKGLLRLNAGDVVRCFVNWQGTGVATFSSSMYILQLAYL